MIVGAGYEVQPKSELDWGKPGLEYRNFTVMDPSGRLLWIAEVHPYAYPSGAVAELKIPGQERSGGIFVNPDGTRSYSTIISYRPPGEFGPILDMLREAGVVFSDDDDDPN